MSKGLGILPRPLPLLASRTLTFAWCVMCCAAVTLMASAASRRIIWADVAPFEAALAAKGLTSSGFPSYVATLHEENLRRVHEGDLDHFIFYCLQSTRFTALPPIEPAISAKAFVESGQVPDDARARVTACGKALGSRQDDPRLAYFRVLMKTTAPDERQRDDVLRREYTRVMRFLYEKEFAARRSANVADAVADLYRTRGLSTDTAVEAGYVVYLGLGVMKSVDPARRVRRVLIVGPGLDLAPRTGFHEASPPESYQPWAVIDALVGLGLSRLDDLEVVAADINPRVIDHLQRKRSERLTLRLASGIEESSSLTFSRDYREYFARLGRTIGDVSDEHLEGRMRKSVRVRNAAVAVVRAEALDIVTERIEGATFDLVIATNILPYFDDVQLRLALSNVVGMMASGSVLVHNEPRVTANEITTILRLPVEQSRHVTIADVRGAAPLGDSVWLQQKR